MKFLTTQQLNNNMVCVAFETRFGDERFSVKWIRDRNSRQYHVFVFDDFEISFDNVRVMRMLDESNSRLKKFECLLKRVHGSYLIGVIIDIEAGTWTVGVQG